MLKVEQKIALNILVTFFLILQSLAISDSLSKSLSLFIEFFF